MDADEMMVRLATMKSIMKPVLTSLIGLAAVFASTSCVMDPMAMGGYGGGGGYGPGPGYGYPGGGGGGGYGSSRAAYDAGAREGSSDKRRGSSYRVDGDRSYPYAMRDAYRSGYAAGWRSTGGGGGSWGGGGWGGGGGYAGRDRDARIDSRHDAMVYNRGISAGRNDRMSGRSYNPTRYTGGLMSGDRAEFVRGYAAGYRR